MGKPFLSMTTPTTRPSLLLRIADPQDSAAWAEFTDLYEPILIRVAKSRGIQIGDAEELAQEVLITVLKSIKNFKNGEQVGSFRRWLATITHNKVRDYFRSIKRIDRRTQGELLDLSTISDRSLEDMDLALETQWRHQMFARAVNAIRDTVHQETWEAFWGTSIEMRSAEQVARELGTSVGNIYVSRSRVIAKLRNWVQQNADPSWENCHDS